MKVGVGVIEMVQVGVCVELLVGVKVRVGE